MPHLVLVRHGQSLWNLENRFTGWIDIDLSLKGEKEAQRAGQLLLQKKIHFHTSYTSLLKRAIRTLWIILKELDEVWLSTHKTWRLNERHYGELQGLNKKDMADQYGEDQVFKWRRSYDLPPPETTSEKFKKEKNQKMFQNISVPVGESLKDTIQRVIPLWKQEIEPLLKQNKNVLIVAHGNSLRALVKYIKHMSDDDVCHFNIPTASPINMYWKDVDMLSEPPDVFEFL